jgi:hypothetical protein
MCAWTSIYQPGQVVHRFPDAERSQVIHSEYESHQCEDFPAQALEEGSDRD